MADRGKSTKQSSKEKRPFHVINVVNPLYTRAHWRFTKAFTITVKKSPFHVGFVGKHILTMQA